MTAREATKALVSLALSEKRAAVIASLWRRRNLSAERSAFTRAGWTVSIVTREAAKARIVAAFAVGVCAAGANF